MIGLFNGQEYSSIKDLEDIIRKMITEKGKKIPDTTVISNIRKFIIWVNDHPAYCAEQRVGRIDRYATRALIDAYFKDDIEIRCVGQQTNTISRHASSIQYLYNNLEYDHIIDYVADIVPFIVKNFFVNDIIKQTSERPSKKVKYVDPHAGLRSSTVTIPDFVSIMLFSINYMTRVVGPICTITGFINFALSFLLGFTKLARGDTVRKFKIEDLRANYQFGPCSNPHENICDLTQTFKCADVFNSPPCLSIIIQKFGSKENNKKKQEVGAYRHRLYFLCTVGITAFSIFMKINDFSDDDFNFTVDDDGVPNWHGHKLITYDSRSTQAAIYTSVFKILSLDLFKTTHIRSSGIAHGASVGLNKESISYQSKHVKDKLDSAYMPELCKEVRLVLFFS